MSTCKCGGKLVISRRPWRVRTSATLRVSWLQAGVRGGPCNCIERPALGSQIHEARAALAGEGVALLTPRFFRFELVTGRLVQPFPQSVGLGTAIWLVYPEAWQNRPTIRQLRQFLLAEAAVDG